MWPYIAAIASIPLLYIVISILKFFTQTWICTRALSKFPKPENYHWFWGHMSSFPGFNEAGLSTIIEWTEQFPRCMTFYLGPIRPVLVVFHPDTVREITKTAEPKALSGGGGYALLRPWFGDGLLVSSGKKWNRTRRLLTPAFHFDVLKPYMKVYNKCTETMIDKLHTRNGNSMSADKLSSHDSVEIFSIMRMCTLNIILKCAFSNNEDVQGQRDSAPYVKAVTSISRLLQTRLFKPHLYMNWLYKRTDEGKLFYFYCQHSREMARHVIKERRVALATHGDNMHNGRYKDFLDILLLARDENGKGLSDQEIQDEVSTFLFAGHDTTATAMSWALYNLAKHPEHQAKVQSELDDLYKIKTRRSKFKVKMNDLSKMPHLTRCIKESMRLHPPTPFISRQTTKPMTLEQKHVPSGSTVNICIYALHHNPAIWGPDHMDFKPERFSLENMDKIDPHAYIPFSAGPRNCIGQHFAMNEMKTVLARILYEFSVSLDTGHPIELMPELNLRAKHGIKLSFHKRI